MHLLDTKFNNRMVIKLRFYRIKPPLISLLFGTIILLANCYCKLYTCVSGGYVLMKVGNFFLFETVWSVHCCKTKPKTNQHSLVSTQIHILTTRMYGNNNANPYKSWEINFFLWFKLTNRNGYFPDLQNKTKSNWTDVITNKYDFILCQYFY